jgi:parallel beta-helix repeat protein
MEFLRIFSFTCSVWLTVSLVASPVEARHCGGTKPCQCGDIVDKNYTLPADLGPCENRGLAVAGGVTLDCAGHAIRGIGERSQGFGIALADGVTGATIKNCDVSGFSRGVRLRGANKNRILNNTVHHNGDFAARVGYGIDIAGGQDNLFQENHVHQNADEGIHNGTGSHGNTFISNRVENNTRENLYFLRADRCVLQKNLVRGGGMNSVFVKHSSFLRLEDNIFHDKPVVFRGDAHDNTLVNNEFVNAGVHFQAYEEQGIITRPTKNVVTGGSMRDAKECLRFSNASGNIIRNLLLTHCNTSVLAKAEIGGAENLLVDMKVNPETFSLDASSVIHVGWRLDIIVQDNTGASVTGAKVQGFNAQQKLVFDVTTDTDGKAPSQDVVAYSLRGSTKTLFTPYRLLVSFGQRTTTQVVSVSDNEAVSILLAGEQR